MLETTVATTDTGAVRGARLSSLAVFRGIPYAVPPVGERRWRAPGAMHRWSGVRDALAFAPSAPQRAGRLDTISGAVDGPQDEDCLYLNVWTPGTDDARRPVFVWFHGGGFVTGSASVPGYDGSRLAADGDLVVVTVNYRLGPFGFLYLPHGSNFGIRDQIAAMQWVRRNIAAFGGDPSRVTIGGQGAGAVSVAAHLTLSESRNLFARAVLQSAPLGVAAHTTASAREITDQFARTAGVDDTRSLSTLPTHRLLDAAADIPFRLVVDGTTLREDPAVSLRTNGVADVDVLIGTTREEMAAFFAGVGGLDGIDRASVVRRLQRPFGDRAERAYAVYARTRPAARPYDVLVDAVTDELFRRPALQFAERRDRRGHAAFVYQFDWPSPLADGPVGAAHMLDLPFTFGTPSSGATPRCSRGQTPTSSTGSPTSCTAAGSRSSAQEAPTTTASRPGMRTTPCAGRRCCSTAWSRRPPTRRARCAARGR
jgi:para-nitrobenzyl esterase